VRDHFQEPCFTLNNPHELTSALSVQLSTPFLRFTMCELSTSLVFGLPVRTTSLLFAAYAFPHLQSPLRFFDLVGLRSRRGTLEVANKSGTTAVGLMAAGVWERIKDELVKVELEAADCRFVNELYKTKEFDPKLSWRSEMWFWFKEPKYQGDMIYCLQEEFAYRRSAFNETRKPVSFLLRCPPPPSLVLTTFFIVLSSSTTFSARTVSLSVQIVFSTSSKRRKSALLPGQRPTSPSRSLVCYRGLSVPVWALAATATSLTHITRSLKSR
jgi:hypothetical protein